MSTEEKTATIPVADAGSSAPSPVPGAPAPKKRKRRHKALRRVITAVIVLAVLAGIAFAVWYFVFRKKEVTGDIVTATASISTIQSTVEGSGNARAGGSAAITVASDGVVQDVMVAEGDQVYEGQPLYNMNSPAAEQKVADAEKAITDQEKNIQSLIRAVSTAEKAVTAREKDVEAREKDLEALYAAIDDRKADVETAKEAVEERKQDVLDRKADVETAKEAVLEAQQAVVEAKQAVEDRKADLEKLRGELAELRASSAELTVTAPFSGKLTEVADLVSGQNLAAGEEIATLVDDSRFKLSLYFSYAYKDAITVGQAATVSLPSAMGSVPGRVEEVNMINFISSEGASFFEVVVSFENPGPLTAGMKASATLTGPDGAAIFPYDSGELTYYDSVAVKTTLAGPLKQISTLRRYADVKAGQTLIIQGSDELDKAVADKQEEIASAEKAVTAAEKAVPTAENGVTAAQRGVTNAEKAVTAAEKAVTDAEKAVTAAEDAVTAASTDDIEAGKQAIEDAKQDIVYAQDDVVAANDAVTAGYERLEELKEALTKAESELLDFNAVAPISGTITSCTIAKGQEVAAGTTVITISDTTNMVVEITVDDRNIPFVKPGMSVDLSDWNDMTYVGTVTKIDMEKSESGYSGMTSYPVTLSVENSSGSLLQGMWLDYSFITSESADCVTVPIQCVKSIVDTDGNPHDVVFIQADSEPENAVSFDPPEDDPYAYNPVKYPTPEEGYWPVPVETGLSDRYNVEIVSGLSDGDTVFSAYMMTGAWS